MYDNGDINVESVYGRSYYWTNIIAIKKKPNDIPVQTTASTLCVTMIRQYSRRSFKPIISQIEPAVKKQRLDPQLITADEVGNNMIYKAFAKTKDLWYLLRLEDSVHNQQ